MQYRIPTPNHILSQYILQLKAVGYMKHFLKFELIFQNDSYNPTRNK